MTGKIIFEINSYEKKSKEANNKYNGWPKILCFKLILAKKLVKEIEVK
jgi:hypothetical protein